MSSIGSVVRQFASIPACLIVTHFKLIGSGGAIIANHNRNFAVIGLLLGIGVGVGLALGGAVRYWNAVPQTRAASPAVTQTPSTHKSYAKNGTDQLSPETAAAFDPDWQRPYPQYQPVGKVLRPFPLLQPGEPAPFDLYRYGGGRGQNVYASVEEAGDFDEFYRRCSEQKPKLMARWGEYLNTRYNFSGKVDPKITMTRSKPIPVGPVVRLPKGVKSWQELATLSAEQIKRRDLFPEGFRSLAHPLHSTGHMVFPPAWTRVHPEHQRFDVDFDLPAEYLPEFPPPLFLTTRPDLGDVSRGREITQANFRELLGGVLTPEQMEGLRLLVSRFPSSWFNHTAHRVTKQPVRGVACFDCHVNGHTNATFELDPSQRPTLARARIETPSLRGNYTNFIFARKRSIRSLDHFSEVEEYFDGDIGLQLHIGGRQLDRPSSNRMGDFNSIIDFPPAAKLDRFGKLDPAKSTPQQLRGQQLFFGKARCFECHPAPYYTDSLMHDLRAEEFYVGRAEGPVKTFSLRGIKDSPPYMHDGSLPTLEDTAEYFNLVFQLRLSVQEKKDLVAFLRCL